MHSDNKLGKGSLRILDKRTFNEIMLHKNPKPETIPAVVGNPFRSSDPQAKGFPAAKPNSRIHGAVLSPTYLKYESNKLSTSFCISSAGVGSGVEGGGGHGWPHDDHCQFARRDLRRAKGGGRRDHFGSGETRSYAPTGVQSRPRQSGVKDTDW